VLLRDATQPLAAAERADNEARFGPLLELTLRRQGRLARMAAELRGSGMYQHGWVADDVSALLALAAADSGWRSAPVLVSPISALAKWQAVRQRLPALAPRRLVAAVNDCTTAEYHWRWRSPQPSLGARLQALSHRLRSPLVARAEARLLGAADRVLVQTAADREALRTLVGEGLAARTLLAPNGVRPDLFAVPADAGAGPEVLFVAELSGEYAAITTWLLDQVWPQVREAVPTARLLVVGRGAPPALRQRLQAAAGAGVRHQDFAADLAPLQAASRVVWSPLWKGFGLINKTLEAMAAARAVVGGTAAFNGIEGFVEGRHGLGLARPDAQALAAATAALLRDPARAAAIGQAARTLVQGVFRWERTADVVREALANPRSDAAVAPPAALELGLR
jgi:glycosyltransferase involved in cell wall biosynthesis